MMKKILIIMLILVSIGCSNKLEHYSNFSNTIVNFFQDPYYNTEEFNEKENELLQSYLSTLTGIDLVVDLDKYIKKEEDYYTNEKNSEDVYVENGKCYIKYEDLEFTSIDPEDPALAAKISKVVCNNYFTILMEEQFNDYEDIANNQKYNYRYLGYIKNDDIYEFVYRSYYTGSGLVIKIYTEKDKIVNFEVIEKKVNDYEFTEQSNSTIISVSLVGIIAVISIVIIYILKNIKK